MICAVCLLFPYLCFAMQLKQRKPNSPKYDERTHFFTPAPEVAPVQPQEKEVKPSSPKYDERTFFYTTPQVRIPSGQKWRSPAQKRSADSAFPPSKATAASDKRPLPQSKTSPTPPCDRS